MHDDFFWSTDLQSIAISTERVFAFDDYEPVYSIFDTGTTHIALPDVYFKSFLLELMKVAGVTDYTFDRQVMFPC
jgi:hypothetical protein